MQRPVALGVALPYSNPIIGVRFTPTVVLQGAPEHFLKYIWYRLLNDKKVNCHVHKLEKAIVQCRTCVRLNLHIADSYYCSAKCYYDTREYHPECHYENLINTSNGNQDRDNYGYDLDNYSVGNGSGDIVVQDGKLWLKVGFLKTYVPSSDDFGCILMLKTQVVNSQSLLKEYEIVTDRVIVYPPTHPRTMIRIETLVGYNSEVVRTGFRVLTYNILADMHASQQKYSYCPTWSLNWAYRGGNLSREIIAYQADILCLQEVQFDHLENFLWPMIREDYSVTYIGREPKIFTRDGYKEYGCATLYRIKKFRTVKEHVLEFERCARAELHKMQPNQGEIACKRLLKDNIAILTMLEPVDAERSLDRFNSWFCVVNTHICASEEFRDVKLWQVATLVNEVEKFAGVLPVLLCGDFNSRPGSAPYDLIVHGEVDRNHREFPVDPAGIFDQINLSHNLSLVSAYSEKILKIGEPQVTHYSESIRGTLDYIFYQEDRLRLKSRLELLQLNNLLPSPQWSSDHIALMADFEFV